MLGKRKALAKKKGIQFRNFITLLIIGAFAVCGGSAIFKNSFAEGSYTVYFRNGATNATFSTQTVEEGGSPQVPGNPSATGYTFTGNYQSSSALSLRSGGSIAANTPFPSSQISDISVNSNITLVSVMAGNKYTVTTVMTGSVPPGLRGSATTFTYSQNFRVNLPSMAAYAKNGYTFAGWNSEVPIYNNSWFYLPAKNIRVVGTWRYTGSSKPANGSTSSGGSSQSYSAQPSTNNTPTPSAPKPTASSSNNSSPSASASSGPSVRTPKTGNDKINTILPSESGAAGRVVCLAIIGAIVAVFAINHRKKLALRSR